MADNNSLHAHVAGFSSIDGEGSEFEIFSSGDGSDGGAPLLQSLISEWVAGVRSRASMVSNRSFESLKDLEHVIKSKPQDISRKMSATLHRRRADVQEKFSQVSGDVQERFTQVSEKITSPPFVRFRDKIMFTLGVLQLLLIEYVMLMEPDKMSWLYSLAMPTLMVLRFIDYKSQKLQNFMIDFCYWAQLLTFVYLYVLPSPRLFKWLFCLSNGPLCGAIVLWSNSLVFHDFDKMTSLFVHLAPPLLTWAIRWAPSAARHAPADLASLTARDCVAVPLCLYLYWQALYLLKTELFDREKFQSDQDLMTSLRWLTERRPHPIYKAALRYGWPRNRGLLLIILAHFLWLSFVFMWATWSGASYYFESFASKYVMRLEQQTTKKRISLISPLKSYTRFFVFMVFALVGLFFMLKFFDQD